MTKAVLAVTLNLFLSYWIC